MSISPFRINAGECQAMADSSESLVINLPEGGTEAAYVVPQGFSTHTKAAARFLKLCARAQFEGMLIAYRPHRPVVTDTRAASACLADALGDYTLIRNRLPLPF